MTDKTSYNESKMRKTITIRRMYGRTEESARKRSQKLVKRYGFVIIDEFISQGLHILLADLTESQVYELQNNNMVEAVENMPEFTLNSRGSIPI